MKSILKIGIMYKDERYRVGLTATEQHTTRFLNSDMAGINGFGSIETEHNFTANGNISYNGFTGEIRFCDSDNPYNHTNVYGLGLRYPTKKSWRIWT